jgi:YVTN family beta-propeller protein
MKHTLRSFAAIMAIAGMQQIHAQSGYHLTQTFHIASNGGWDYVFVDDHSNKLYLSHTTQVNILDKNTGDSLGVVPNTTGVHGIAVVHALNKGYTSNGRSNNVTVFDLTTNKTLTQISTGENPDAIMYEEYSKKIITCNGRSKDLSIIDPATDKVVATISVGGKLETAVSDNAGKLFVNVEDKNEIAVIDLNKKEVIAHWSIAPADGPTGLAIDVKMKRLFAGCDKQLVVVDAENGKVVTTLPIGEGCDGVAYDAHRKLVFTSNGSGTMTVIQAVSKNEFKVIENVVTKRSARTIAVDESTHKVYLPAADTEQLPAGTKGRPKMIPNTFQVLVLEK